MIHAVDMHCDTLMHAFLIDGSNADLSSYPELSIDLAKLEEGNAMAQFFAVFIPPAEAYRRRNMEPIPEDEYIHGCVQVMNNTVERYSSRIAHAYTAEDIERNFKAGKISAVLSMEDGVAVHGDMQKLDAFYNMGFRCLSLTWNFENCFGYPNSKDDAIMQKGLKDFGKRAVRHMQQIGMLVDVSHLSDGGFYDVAEIAERPFVATHSNCRSICSHQRNMTDDMIRILHKAGGVMGINFCPAFLKDGSNESNIEDMAAMAMHEKEIAGTDVIALGTDFDGIEGKLEVADPHDMIKLADALIHVGFASAEVDKIFHGNVLRVLRQTMRD